MSTSFQRLGGFARVRRIVSDFYERVLESERLAGYFADVDTRRLVDHQTKFISALLGGPASFSDEHLRRAHAHLGISPAEVREMAEILRDTLEDFGLEPADVARVHAHVLSLREVVAAPAAAARGSVDA